MKPFNLDEAKAGKPVCTREGHPVRIVCFDVLNSDYPIIGVVKTIDEEFCATYTALGEQYINGDTSPFDLFMVSEIKEGWINICKDIDDKYITDTGIYQSEEEAINSCIEPHFTTIKITWEE